MLLFVPSAFGPLNEGTFRSVRMVDQFLRDPRADVQIGKVGVIGADRQARIEVVSV